MQATYRMAVSSFRSVGWAVRTADAIGQRMIAATATPTSVTLLHVSRTVASVASAASGSRASDSFSASLMSSHSEPPPSSAGTTAACSAATTRLRSAVLGTALPSRPGEVGASPSAVALGSPLCVREPVGARQGYVHACDGRRGQDRCRGGTRSKQAALRCNCAALRCNCVGRTNLGRVEIGAESARRVEPAHESGVAERPPARE